MRSDPHPPEEWPPRPAQHPSVCSRSARVKHTPKWPNHPTLLGTRSNTRAHVPEAQGVWWGDKPRGNELGLGHTADCWLRSHKKPGLLALGSGLGRKHWEAFMGLP